MDRNEYTYDLMGRMKTTVYKFHEKRYNPAAHGFGSIWTEYVTRAVLYDNLGNIVKELDGCGYDAGTGSAAAEKIASGYGTEYTYNLAGKLVTTIDPVSKDRALPFTVKYEYDALGRKASETDANGAITIYGYNDAGNVTSVTVKKSPSASGSTIRTSTYDFTGNLLTETDGNGNTTGFEYNALGKTRKALYPGDETIPSNTVTYQYDAKGNPVMQADSTGRVDTYTYDSQDRVLSHIQKRADNSEAITTSVRYDVNGNKRFETDGKGYTTEYSYDKLNRLVVSSITVHGTLQTTAYAYDKNGNQTSVTDWRKNTSRNAYDSMNRLVEKVDAKNISIQKLEYNHNNAQVKSYDALDNLTRFDYDRNNRLVRTIDAEGHVTAQAYDDAGNVQTRTDGRGISTTYMYDEFNRLITVINPRLEKTGYTYDLNGNMLTQTDGEGDMTLFEYNAANKVVKKIDYGGRMGETGSYTYVWAKVESYTYYADGSLKDKTDRNGKITGHTYDVHGRIRSQSIGTTAISYTYDNNGNQLTMTDSTGTTTRTYDELGRVTAKTVPDIGTSTYNYDIITGVPAGCTLEGSIDPKGNVTDKVTDAAGRLWKVTADSKTTTYEYYDNGNRKSVLYPNGAKEEYTYYSDNLIRTLTNKKANGSTIDVYSYTYDGAHNQTSKVDSKGTTFYTYDGLNRLDSVTEPDGKTTSYMFDKAGNRLSESVTIGESTVVTIYTYNEQNRLTTTLTQADGASEKVDYSYDNNGNMASKSKSVTKPVDPNSPSKFELVKAGMTTNTDVSLYEYDVWNQLSKSIEGDKTIVYRYNGDGLRTEKAVNGQMTRYLYESDKVVLETGGSGNQTAWNVQGLNLLARKAGSETLFYMYNGHADVTALIDGAGTV